MAEERLIDDDKDRKYKIRINEDGEEELVINPQAEEEAEDIVGFEVPDFDGDDEEAAIMTPEQYAARQKQREEEALKRAKKTAAYIERAKKCLEEGDFSGAEYALSEAGELDSENGEVYALKVKTYSKNFTDWSMLDDCAEAADGVRDYADAELKNSLFLTSMPLTEKIAQTQTAADELNFENEEKKSERRAAFKARKKKTLIAFGISAAVFALFVVLAISIGVKYMFTREDALFTVITIALAVFALGGFVATLITAHNMWDACRNVKLNERNSSTKLGREYEEKRGELEKLTRIYAAFKPVSDENLGGAVSGE